MKTIRFALCALAVAAATPLPAVAALKFDPELSQPPTAPAGELQIEIHNKGTGHDSDKVVMELRVPAEKVSSKLLDTRPAKDGKIARASLARFAGVKLEGGKGTWTAWAAKDDDTSFIGIVVRNDVDATNEKTALADAQRGTLSGPEKLKLTLPLPEAPPPLASFPVTCRYGSDPKELSPDSKSFDFALVGGSARPPEHGTTTLPLVTFGTDQSNPMALELGRSVKLQWRVEHAQSVTLKGRLDMSGNSSIGLAIDAKTKVADGSRPLRALGRADYLLVAKVLPPGSDKEMEISRIVTIDVRSLDRFANMVLLPATTLPGGDVDVRWFATDLIKGKKDDLRLIWTDHRGNRQVRIFSVTEDTGDECLIAPNEMSASNVSVKLEVRTDEVEKRIELRKWERRRHDEWVKTAVTANVVPDGLAIAGNTLVLSTYSSDPKKNHGSGLWRTHLDPADPNPFGALRKFDVAVGVDWAKEWLGVAGAGTSFVALYRKPEQDKAVVQLVRFSEDGKMLGQPVTLPGTFNQWNHFQVVVAGKRIYAFAFDAGGNIARAASVDSAKMLEGKGEPIDEQLLQGGFIGTGRWNVTALGSALYALNRSDGSLLRFDATEMNVFGSLSFPKKVPTRAVDTQATPASVVDSGIFINAGGVLVMLGSGKGETLDMRAQKSMVCPKRGVNRDLAKVKQDVVFNPHTRAWSACGHDLDIPDGAVAAFWDGDHPRLWVVQQNGAAATLALNSPRLFAPDYFEDDCTLESDYFGAEVTFTIKNKEAEDLSWTWRDPNPAAQVLEWTSTAAAAEAAEAAVAKVAAEETKKGKPAISTAICLASAAGGASLIARSQDENPDVKRTLKPNATAMVKIRYNPARPNVVTLTRKRGSSERGDVIATLRYSPVAKTWNSDNEKYVSILPSPKQ